MVTAILIPIICIYFYWLTKKEMKDNYEKWLKLNDTLEEAIITGTILTIREEKQRFYYHRYIYVIEMTVKSETKTHTVKKVFPLTKSFTRPSIQKGDFVKLYGNWKGQAEAFNVGRIEKLN